jgi:aryl-alcohol dehydrogenase-like predicted oxidoreductase
MKQTVKNRLILGTAQIGMQYGIANTTGQPDFANAKAIIRDAWNGGIHEFDSAQGYGEIEKILGSAFDNLNIKHSAKVITKFSPTVDLNNKKEMRNSIIKSLDDLGIAKLHGILLHREKMLNSWKDGIGETLREFKSEGLVEHLGVSVSNSEFAEIAMEEKDITIIQIPSNILDRRFERADIFNKADKKNKTVYVRSAFLQGLLLLNSESLPESMQFTKNVLIKFSKLADKYSLSKQELAMGFVIKAYPYAKIIFGAETSQQVKSNLSMRENPDIISDKIVSEAQNIFSDVSNHILNPGFWPNAL